MIILKVMLGNGNLVGVLIDNLDWLEKVGIICGDDICLIICCLEENVKILIDCFIDMF